MPGVPPDSVAQVKKGLRGLFNRRKSKEPKPQQTQPTTTSTSKDGATLATTAAPAAPVTAASAAGASIKRDSPLPPPPPQAALTDSNKAPQLSAPSQEQEANAIDLNPAASDVEPQPSKAASDPNAGSNDQPTTTQAVASTAVTEPPADTAAQQSTKVTEPPAKSIIEPSRAPTESSTGMSATSGPLGDHMAEVYIDDDEDVGPRGETLAESGKIEEGEKA